MKHGVGGRLATLISEATPKCYVDYGAQYFELTKQKEELSGPIFNGETEEWSDLRTSLIKSYL